MSTVVARVTTLHRGDVVLGLGGERLDTLLGSCVAILLTDPRRTVGVMCHIVHCRSATDAGRDSTAHADAAWRAMQRLLAEQGLAPHLCVAHVIGGGDMFSQVAPRLTVGDDNAAWALQTLSEAGIRVQSVDVGGTVYRQVRWTIGAAEPEVVSVPL